MNKEFSKPEPIIVPGNRILYPFIIAHPELIFIYGSAYLDNSYLGQASQCKGRDNCFYVPTKFRLCLSDPEAFFHDRKFELLIKPMIDNALVMVPRDGRAIIPFPKIGRGRAELDRRAPKTYAYLMSEIEKIAYGNIVYNYNYTY